METIVYQFKNVEGPIEIKDGVLVLNLGMVASTSDYNVFEKHYHNTNSSQYYGIAFGLNIGIENGFSSINEAITPKLSRLY